MKKQSMGKDTNPNITNECWRQQITSRRNKAPNKQDQKNALLQPAFNLLDNEILEYEHKQASIPARQKNKTTTSNHSNNIMPNVWWDTEHVNNNNELNVMTSIEVNKLIYNKKAITKTISSKHPA